MALEDFFTLTEMKDGLTVRARVEELVAVMNKEKDCIMKNVGDAMRQWSTVASVIAATENKDCLDHFIQLDGLLFIDRWLKDAQKHSVDASDCFIEESILALLKALEKLQIDTEKLTSSGISLTMRDLLSHKSNNIQDKAKSVLENLKLSSVTGAAKPDSEEAQVMCDDKIEPGNMVAGESSTSISSSAIGPDQKTEIDKHVHQLVAASAASSGCCVDQQSDGFEAVGKEPDKVASDGSESDLNEVKDKFESSIRKEAFSSELKSVSDCAGREQGTDVRIEARRLETLPEAVSAEIHNESVPNKLGKAVVYPASIMPKCVESPSSFDNNFALEADGKVVRVTDNHVDSSSMKSMSADLQAGGNSTRAVDSGVLVNCTVTVAQKSSKQGDDSHTKTPDSPVDGSMLGKSRDRGNKYPPHREKLSCINQAADLVKRDQRHLRDSSLLESSTSRKRVDVTSKMSAADLEYGAVDALDIACQVAKEVERQVAEDYEEQFGSFPNKNSRGDALDLAGSPDSSNGKKDQHADGSPFHESPVEKMSDEDSSGESSADSDNVDAERESCLKVAESSQATDAAPEAANSADKGTSEIDLNLEICSEAEDNAGNSVSNPVAVISASRAVAAPGLPESPLKFEGDLGWKGSAATSAFRPASPRRTSDGNKTILVEEPTGASREGQDFLIDLNILADDGDDKTVSPISSKQNLALPGAPSVESLVEPSPRRSEKLSFDLNQMSEDGDAPLSSSPASSSSSLKPAMRNFDLNDRPLNLVDPSELQPCLATSSCHKSTVHGVSSDDSVISIMGAKVKKNTFGHQAPFSFFNGGRASEPMVDSNLARSGPPPQYAVPPHIYSYNGIPMRPPTMQYFHHPMYGPGGSPAHMVDSRLSMMPPQFVAAPPSTFQASFGHQPSFTTNMVGPLPPSRPHLNFNPGFVEGANRVDPGGFRQFIPGQVRSAEEHNNLQPSFPGIVGGKRKEPDGGWEPFMTNYKHHQPPHL